MTKKWDISYGWPLFIFFSKIALFVDNTQTFSRATDLILGDMHYHIMECSESGVNADRILKNWKIECRPKVRGPHSQF